MLQGVKDITGSPLPQQGSKVSTPKLQPGDYSAFVYASGKDKKGKDLVSAPASAPFTVPKPGATPPSAPAPGECPSGSWKIDYGPTSSDNALVPGGVPSMKTASNPDQERAALLDQLEAIKANPKKLAQAIHLNLPGHPVVQVSDLVDGACASQTASGYYVQLRDLFNNPTTIVTSGEAPSDGINTGWDGTEVVQNSTPGISGDRKGIHVKLPDGTEYWILWRCGNWVIIPGKTPLALPKGRAGVQQAEAVAPTSTPGHSASTSSSGQSRPTGSSSTSSRTSASSTSAAPSPRVIKDNTQATAAMASPQTDSTGQMHGTTSSGSTASSTTAASPTLAEQHEQSAPVPPTGTATATAEKTGDAGMPAG